MHILPSFYAGYIISVHRIVTDCIVLVNSHVCWTYSHHCQIADMKPSQRIMERRISGGSYMCWMDFHNAILCCGFLCTLLISVLFVLFVSILCLSCVYIPATTPRATTPHLYRTGYHAFTTTARLPRLCISFPATTP